jgi:hypothetical protein
MKLIEDLELYSDLLLSVGTHKGIRPLEPIEVAKLIDRLQKEESENYQQLSRRLGFKDVTQTKNFLNLLNLPETVHYSLGWKTTDEEKIPFTNGVIFSELENKNDMEYLVKIGIQNKIKKNEAISIVQIKKKFPKKSIEECVDEVLKIRPVVVKGYLIINTLQDDTISKLSSNAKRESIPTNNLVVHVINKLLNKGKAENAIIKGKTIFLTVDEDGYRSITNLQEQSKVRLRNLIDFIINEAMKND